MNFIHPQLDQIYLGYTSKQSIPIQQLSYELSYIGGYPSWIVIQSQKQINSILSSLKCQSCNNIKNNYKKQKTQLKLESQSSQQKEDQNLKIKEENIEIKQQIKQKHQNNQNNKKSNCNNSKNACKYMTFIGQIYCPLQAQYTYHRAIYIFYCQYCMKRYQIIRQQAPSNHSIKQQQNYIKTLNQNLNILSSESYQIETDSMNKKDILKIINKAKIDVEQQTIEEQQQQQFSQQEQQQIKNFQSNIKLSKQDLKQMEKQLQQQSMQEIKENKSNSKLKQQQNQFNPQTHPSLNAPKDQNFQIYRKIMPQLKYPTLLYCSPPIHYNTQVLNPKHKCKYCSSQLKLQIQITEQLLSSITKNKKLAAMDWGSLFIYTCTASCFDKNNKNLEFQQQIIVQYEADAIKDQEIKKLKKKTKNRKKQKIRKSKSKSKGKEKNQNQNEQKNKQIKICNEEEGDWD